MFLVGHLGMTLIGIDPQFGSQCFVSCFFPRYAKCISKTIEDMAQLSYVYKVKYVLSMNNNSVIETFCFPQI
jgi:hypothetical protein